MIDALLTDRIFAGSMECASRESTCNMSWLMQFFSCLKKDDKETASLVTPVRRIFMHAILIGCFSHLK